MAGYVVWASKRPLSLTAQTFTVQPGKGTLQVGRELATRGVIQEPYSFVLWARWKGYTHRIQAGEYRLRDGSRVRDLLEQMVRGEVVHYTVTLVEGWTFRQVRAALRQAPRLQAAVSEKKDSEIMMLLGKPELHPEGRFFPDTYVYSATSSDLDILRAAFRSMHTRLTEAWAERADGLELSNPAEALTLASIIEKETGVHGERGLIAGVFHNRLRRGMRLQTDPTVIYGLGDQFSGNLTRKHLRTDTPYNTYTRTGLPPTPIAMPGEEAIHAALHPESTAALYFVARGDGSHHFSETLGEHNRAVAKYQLRRQPPRRAGGNP
ncbi:MAG: endolytic transglycosylase MltG [Gammaproteobacteria bacterium]|nr:endolytic transglycosylase MltG [Gammaproteobacteria bacterium]